MGAKMDSYWEPAKAELLKNPNELLERLKGYDKESISDDLINKLRPFIEDDDF